MFKNVIIAILSLFILGQIWLNAELIRIIDQQDKTVNKCCGFKVIEVKK